MAVDISKLQDIIVSSEALYKADLKQEGRFLDFGWPLLNKATLGLDCGVFLIAGPPNLGKSAVISGIRENVMALNDDIFVLDFSLDDNKRDRIRNAVASHAKIPINWVKLPKSDEVPMGARELRRDIFRQWSTFANSRLRIIEEKDFDEKARNLSVIRDVVRQYAVRMSEFGKRLVVIIDGFHNIVVDEVSGDDNVKLTHLSKQIKNLAEVTNSIIIATAHTPKGSMRRGLDQDAVKGPGGATYDAKIIATIFSDYKVNRAKAEIFHEAELPHDPGSVRRLPVVELDITKNKASSFQDVIFLMFYPEYSYLEEAPDQWQMAWKSVIYGSK